MRRLGNRPDALIEALHSAQEAFGYLDDDALRYVGDTPVGAAVDGLRRRDLLPLLHAQAAGRAHVRRVHRDRLLHQRRRRDPGRDPRRPRREAQARRPPTARLSLLTARCLGACSLAPAAIVDGEVEGGSSARRARRRGWRRYDASRSPARRPPRPPGRAGVARSTASSRRAGARLRLRLRGGQLPVGRVARDPRSGSASRSPTPGMTDVAVKRVGCLGLCAAGPLVQIPETGELFSHVRPDDARRRSSRRSAAVDAGADRVHGAAPFFARQVRIVDRELRARSIPRASRTTSPPAATRRCARVLTTMTPAEVRDEITKSGLRGRGGAGYPTGLKWNTVAKATGAPQVRHLQRRRGRPRRVHGPQRARERPAPRARGHGDRGLRGRRQRRATSTAAPSTRSPSSGCARRSARPRSAGYLGHADPATRSSPSRSTSGSAPARSSAARRPR